MSQYHRNFIDPLKNQIHILQSDFDSYKTSTNPKIDYPESPLPKHYTNDLLINNDERNIVYITNNRNLVYDDEQPYGYNFVDIYPEKKTNNFDTKENYPILEPTNPNNFDTFSSAPFAEFVLNNFPSPYLNKDFEVESVDEEDDEDKLPKNNAVVETVLVPQYLKLINNLEMFKFINTNEGLNIDTKGMRNDELRKKIMEKLKLAGKSSSIVYLPADKLTDKQIADGEKLKGKK
jgi:hypothetical protein